MEQSVFYILVFNDCDPALNPLLTICQGVIIGCPGHADKLLPHGNIGTFEEKLPGKRVDIGPVHNKKLSWHFYLIKENLALVETTLANFIQWLTTTNPRQVQRQQKHGAIAKTLF